MKQELDSRFKEPGIFSYNSEGFNIEINDVTRSIKWSDIERLSAYKVDLFTTDEIYMEIVWRDSVITITEETNGWDLFIEKFTGVLNGVNADWENEVTKETFTTNWTVVYEKTGGENA